MKKLAVIIMTLSTIILLTGCGKTASKNTSDKTQKDKGNCKILECINKIDVKDNLDKVNETMGFEGEKTNEGDGYTTYKWALNDYESVEVTFYTSSSNIKINFNDNIIQSDKVDFSKYDEVSKSLKAGDTVTYDDLKKKFKDSGTLVEKSSSTNKYRWVNSEGGYLNANFSVTSGKCSMIIGRI